MKNEQEELPDRRVYNLLECIEDRSIGLKKYRQNLQTFFENRLVNKPYYDEIRCEMPGHPRSTFLMVFSPDGSIVASTHGNHNIYLTDMKSGRNIKTLSGHPRTPWCIAFHPTSNQIVASGCLGGQVRVWDLSGGSEVWSPRNQSVIASIAFHPNERVLVIATCNELYFWDWSKPEPFTQIATANPKEKVRYVAFDRLGHKLITGIANSPQTRWERVRAPVPVPRQAERSASPYRLRIIPRMMNSSQTTESNDRNDTSTSNDNTNMPERERRLTRCHEDLMREFEQLVKRYLKLYRPRHMIDRGTDPMEFPTSDASTNANTNDSEQNSSEPILLSSLIPPNDGESEPQSSTPVQTPLVLPSRILAMKRMMKEATNESHKHKSTGDDGTESKKMKLDKNEETNTGNEATTTPDVDVAVPSTSGINNSRNQDSIDKFLDNVRKTAEEELKNKILPIIRSVPKNDRPELMRLFENSRVNIKMKFNQKYVPQTKRSNRRILLTTSSDSSSSSEDEQPTTSNNTESGSSTTTPSRVPTTNIEPETSNSDMKNFNTELEHLVVRLLAEIERNDSRQSRNQSPTVETTQTPNDFQESQRNESATSSPSPPPPPRRRFGTCRTSAFMPTRVNQNRFTSRFWGCRLFANTLASPDEVINYAQRDNNETSGSNDEAATLNHEIMNMYTNIGQNLESGMNDLRNIRASSRPVERLDMLNGFSQRLENIMNQSDTILRNISEYIRNSIASLPNVGDRSSNEPTLNFNDRSFYMRDHSERNTPEENEGQLYNVVASDHNYPRNPAVTSSIEHMSPLMASFHLTITHIQRQARLLRQQVENVERSNRAMLEIGQLQLIKQLIWQLLRHVSNTSANDSNRNATLLSVRQMMAGTRISDSYETTEDTNQSGTTSASTSTTNETQPTVSRPRHGRKTYPPSRLCRLQRQSRRSVMVHFPRRYLSRPERFHGRTASARSRAARTSFNMSFNNPSPVSLLTPAHLDLVGRRLEQLLVEHLPLFARSGSSSHSSSSSRIQNASSDLAEHILSLRLEGCVLRMDRIAPNRAGEAQRENSGSEGTSSGSSSGGGGGGGAGGGSGSGTTTAVEAVAVTRDSAARYAARHTLCVIIDATSRHLEEHNGAQMLSYSLRMQIHNVLVMSMLLTMLLFLNTFESLPPPPSGINLDSERETLPARIEQVCSQLLQNPFGNHSQQLTRCLRLMRLIMRQASRTLGQTYNAHRSAMDANRQEPSQLIDSVNRCLRSMQRIRQENDQTTNSEETTTTSTTTTTTTSTTTTVTTTTTTMTTTTTPTVSPHVIRVQSRRGGATSSDDNESNCFSPNPTRNRNNSSNLYRTNNVNLVDDPDLPSTSSTTARTWNVPSVQVNDVPVSLQQQTNNNVFTYHSRFVRQHFAGHNVIELISNQPTAGLFRPRLLHPLYSEINHLDSGDVDEIQRENTDECDMTNISPNHRIQVWDMSTGIIPGINNPQKNVVVNECKIHNDASVDIAKDGTFLVTLLPSGGYLNITNRLGVYSLKWDTLGQCLYTTNLEQTAVSVSLSPLGRHLVVGLVHKRPPIFLSDRWTMAHIFIIDDKNKGRSHCLPMFRELKQNRDSRAPIPPSVNCIRWLPSSGQGLIYATNAGQLIILT